MDRLISLFREASEGDDPRGRPPNPPAGDEPGLPEQPVYFLQLMDYLRERKEEAAEAAAEWDALIGGEDEGPADGGAGAPEGSDDAEYADVEPMAASCCGAHR
jgi:hypothetical protein